MMKNFLIKIPALFICVTLMLAGCAGVDENRPEEAVNGETVSEETQLSIPVVERDDLISSVENALFIAHAGGMVDNKVYSNSFEAIETSMDRGFNIIEVDVSITSDGKYVLRHSWGDDLWQDNISAENVPTLEEFLQADIYYEYTALSLNDFFEMLESCNVKGVLHLKMSNYEEGEAFAEFIKDESTAFDEKKIYFMTESKDVYYGIRDTMGDSAHFIYWITDYSRANDEMEFCEAEGITLLTFSDNVEIEELKKFVAAGYGVWVYRTENIEKILDYLGEGIGIYTNFFAPAVYDSYFNENEAK